MARFRAVSFDDGDTLFHTPAAASALLMIGDEPRADSGCVCLILPAAERGVQRGLGAALSLVGIDIPAAPAA